MTTQLRQPSPPGGIHPHHGPPGQVNVMQRINPAHVASLNEVVWLQIGLRSTQNTSEDRESQGLTLYKEA